MSERQALAPGRCGARGRRRRRAGAATVSPALRRQCFGLGHTEIYIRPSITLAEPTDLQENFSKDKKTKSKQTRGTLAPESLPKGKIKAQSFWPSFPISSVFREKADHVHTTSTERRSKGRRVHMTTLY